MSKLILVTNPINNEQIEYSGDHPTLLSLIQGFVISNPDYVNYFFGQDSRVAIHINGEKVTDFNVLESILSDSDEIIIHPSINEPVTIIAMISMAIAKIAAVGSAVWGAGMAVTGAGTFAMSAATVAGAGSTISALGGTVITVGGIVKTALAATALIGVASAFSSHKPSMSGGDDDPGRNSPTYGWHVQSSSDEGIPIAIPYGKTKVGGNIISTVCESRASFIYDWFAPKDSCPLIAIPLIPSPVLPIPFVNVALTGLWPPVRGFYCKLDPNPWFYIFFSIKVLTWGDVGDFKEVLENLGNDGYIRNKEDLDYAFEAIKNGISGFFQRRFNASFSAQVLAKINSWRASGIGANKNDVIDLLGFDKLSLSRSDFGSGSTTAQNTIIEEIYRHITTVISGRNLTIEVVFPALTGTEYGITFDYEANSDRNLGIYIVGCIVGDPYNTVPQWCISDFMGLTVNKDFINFENFTLAGPQIGLSDEQYLNQLIALGEGECTGLEQVFVNDNPISSFPAVKYFFCPGKNEQVLSSFISNDEMDSFTNTATSYSVNAELNEPFDYALHTCNVPVNNVYVRCSFIANRMSVKGKLGDLEDKPIHFAILVGFDDTSDFSNFIPGSGGVVGDLIANLANLGIEGRYIPFIYKEYGGSRETIHKMYRAFPLVDYINGKMEDFVRDFPGTIQVMCAFFGITQVDGEDIDWMKFNRVGAGFPGVPYSWDDCTDYREQVYDELKEKVQELYINVSRRLVVKVIRLSPHVDNNRYSDKMNVLGFDQITYAGFNYPNTSLLGIRVRATEQFSGSAPKITTILKGKKIRVPKLVLLNNSAERVYHEFAWFDEDVGRYRSMNHNGQLCMYSKDSEGNYVWIDEYSNNPIWCLYDLLTNARYGLGSYIEHSDHDINRYIAMAQHCDEMVPDGTQRFAAEFTPNSLTDTDIDYFTKGQLYFDEETGNWLRDVASSSVDQTNYGYRKRINGQAVFSKNSSGGWTKSIITELQRFTDSATGVFSYVRFLFLRAYTNGTSYWTNNPPLNTGNREYQLGEKRYQLNLYIDDQSSAIDTVKLICDTFRCSPVWVGGMVRPVIDRLEDPKSVLGMGNIIQGSMGISYTPISDIPNIITAQFQNEENYYEKDTRQIIDPDIDESFSLDITRTPRRKDIKLIGISNPSQIQRELHYRMMTGKHRTSLISFKTGIENLNMVAGDVFEFTHDLLINSGMSGRILDRDSDALILDQDVSSLTGSLVIQIKNISSDGTESVEDYSITSIGSDGRTIQVSGLPEVDSDFPFKFRPYIISNVTNTSEKYRALTVIPDTNGEVDVTAIVYKEEVFGDKRLLNNGSGYTAYSDGTIAFQENRLSLVPVLFSTYPVTDLKAYAQLSSFAGKADVVLSFRPPVALKYVGALIQWKDQSIGYYPSENVKRVGRQAVNQVIIENLSIGNTYTFSVTAEYKDSPAAGSHYSYPVEVILKIDTSAIINDDDDPENPENEILTPSPPKNLRLSPLSVSPSFTNWIHPELANNYCYHSFFTVEWDRGGFDGSNNFWEQKGNWIDHYVLSIKTSYDNRQPENTKEIVLPFWSSSYTVTLLDMGIQRWADRENVKNVNISIVAFSNHGRFSSPNGCVRIFAPIDETVPGLSPPDKVFTYPIYFGVIVEWMSMYDWVDVDHFEVELRGWKAGNAPKSTTDESSSDYYWHSPLNKNNHVKKCSLPFTYFHIPYSEKLERLGKWPFGVMIGVTWKAKVTVVNKQGAVATSFSLPGDSSDSAYINDSSGGGNDDVSTGAIPDWALSSTTTNTAIFDNVGVFGVPPTVDWMRTNALNYTTDYDERQELVDSIVTNKNGITYNCTALTTGVARLAYHSPGEERYKGLYVYTDVPARVWVEYLCPVAGDYTLAEWRYLGGTSSHTVSGGYLVDLGGLTPFYTVDRYVNIPAGGTQLDFPFTVVTRFIRLVIRPSSGSNVTVRELRFNRTGEFDSLTVGELSAISADLGTVTAGSIWINLVPEQATIIDTGKGGLYVGDWGIVGYNGRSQVVFSFWTYNGAVMFKGWNGEAAVIVDTGENSSSTADGVIRISGSGKGIVIGDQEDSITIGREIGEGGTTNYIRLDAGTSVIELSNGGNINVLTEGQIKIESDKGIKVGSAGNIEVASGGYINIAAQSRISISSNGYIELDSDGEMRLSSSSHIKVASGGDIELQAGSDLNLIGATMTLSSDSFMELNGTNVRIHTSGTFGIGVDFDNPAFLFNIYNEDLKIGKFGSKSMIISGKDGVFYSYNFESGLLGKGFQISSDGSIEANDISLRGTLSASTFVYDEISSVGGKFIFTKTASLSRGLDSVDDDVIFLDNDPGFDVGEFIWIKQGIYQERMKIIRSYPWYSDMSYYQKEVTQVGTPFKWSTTKYAGDSCVFFNNSFITVDANDDFKYDGDFCWEAAVYLLSEEDNGTIISAKGISSGNNFYRDYSSGEHICTSRPGYPPSIDESDKKFGLSSCKLKTDSGSYTYFSFTQQNENDISNLFSSSGEEYTIEFFTKPSGNTSGTICASYADSEELIITDPRFGFSINYNTNKVYHTVTSGYELDTVSGELTLGSDWVHVAAQRRGTSIEIYVDGSLTSSCDSRYYPSFSGENIWVGKWPLSSYYGGQIDEFRISNTARYSGESLTVPTEQFVNDDNTVVLFHFNDDNEEILRLGYSGERGFYFQAKSAENDVNIYLEHGQMESGETWHNVAISRNSGSFKLFVNGSVVDSANTESPLPEINYPTMIAAYNYIPHFVGYMDELRISNGQARYTSDYTPSTEIQEIDSDHVLYLPFDTPGGVYEVERGFTSTVSEGYVEETFNYIDDCSDFLAWTYYNLFSGGYGIIRNDTIIRTSGGYSKLDLPSDFTTVVGSRWNTKFKVSTSPNSISSTYKFDDSETNCYQALCLVGEMEGTSGRGLCFTIGRTSGGVLSMFRQYHGGSGTFAYETLFPLTEEAIYEMEVYVKSEYSPYSGLYGYYVDIYLYDSNGTRIYTITNVPVSCHLNSVGYYVYDFSSSGQSYIDVDFVSIVYQYVVEQVIQGDGSKYLWPKGTVLVSLGGAVNDGFVLIDAESSTSPYLDLYRRSGSVHFESYQLKVRLGNLQGVADITNGTWHDTSPGYGLYCDNVYLKGKLYLGSGQDLKLVTTQTDSSKLIWTTLSGGALVHLTSSISSNLCVVELYPLGLVKCHLDLGNSGNKFDQIYLYGKEVISLLSDQHIIIRAGNSTSYQLVLDTKRLVTVDDSGNYWHGYTGTFKDYYGNNVYFCRGLCIGVL